MGVQFKQLGDSSLGLEGSANGNGGFIPVSTSYNVPTAGSVNLFVADRPYVVQAIRGRVEAAGSGGAATATIVKVPSGTAVGSGTALHTGTYNLVGTAATQQALTLATTASTLLLAAGYSIAINYTVTATSATGCVTVTLNPA